MELQPTLPSSPRHISPPGKPQQTMDTGVASWCCYKHYITYHVHNIWKNIAHEYRIHRYHAYVYTENYMHSIKIAGQSYEPNDVLPLSLRRSTPANVQYIWWMCWKLLYSFAFVQSRMYCSILGYDGMTMSARHSSLCSGDEVLATRDIKATALKKIVSATLRMQEGDQQIKPIAWRLLTRLMESLHCQQHPTACVESTPYASFALG